MGGTPKKLIIGVHKIMDVIFLKNLITEILTDIMVRELKTTLNNT